jgi:hypothetical protein
MSHQGCFGPFGGAVAKHVRKANISLVVVFVNSFDSTPVKERRDFHLTDFRELCIWNILLFVDTLRL